jgi:hypothetical protein
MYNYELRRILVRMKMKMKSAFISSNFSGWANIDENVVFVTHDVVHGPLDTM